MKKGECKAYFNFYACFKTEYQGSGGGTAIE